MFYLILREVLLVILITRIITQRSSLWMSLILIPSSFALIWGWRDPNIVSGLIIFIIIIIFIGGLLVLLVRVASTVDQEQSSSWIMYYLLLPIIAIFLIFYEGKNIILASEVYLITWLSWSQLTLTLICRVLVFSLILITLLILIFKGSLRRL